MATNWEYYKPPAVFLRRLEVFLVFLKKINRERRD